MLIVLACVAVSAAFMFMFVLEMLPRRSQAVSSRLSELQTASGGESRSVLQRRRRAEQTERLKSVVQAFGEQLHHDPAPDGTEGPPHENLPLTGRGSGKHQQRDVAADHHEKQRGESVDRMDARPDKKVLRDCNEGFGVRQHLRL